MKTNYQFVKNLFNKGEKIANNFDNCNNYQDNFYKIEINRENNIQLESGCINEYGEKFFNNDVREYTPSYNEYKKLLNISKGKSVFCVYED